jgi:predicted RNase H-like nuclease (RuvC/YqgF family)
MPNSSNEADNQKPASQQPLQATGEQEWKETIDRISGSIAWCRENGEQETEISWGNQEGILLTVKEAEYFLSLQSRLSSLEQENERLEGEMNLEHHRYEETILQLESQLREAKEENEKMEKENTRLTGLVNYFTGIKSGPK